MFVRGEYVYISLAREFTLALQRTFWEEKRVVYPLYVWVFLLA